MDGFRGAVMASGGSAVFSGLTGLARWSSKRGNSPTAFDAVDGSRLAGPQGSHPLAAVSIDEMLQPRSDGLEGAIEITHPVRIGEAIEGHIKLTALRDIAARGAVLRPVGAVITEQRGCRRLGLARPLDTSAAPFWPGRSRLGGMSRWAATSDSPLS